MPLPPPPAPTACTRCGVCLESCPTYTLTGAELESPRGRIALIQDALDNGATVTAAAGAHIDSCLGCMACVSACPEDVPYADLLSWARAAVARDVLRPPRERLVREAALRAPALRRAARPLTRTTAPLGHAPAQGSQRGRVGLLRGCAGDGREQAVDAAALELLSAEGYEVVAPALAGCCGARELQAGAFERARRRAQRTLDAFAAVGALDHVTSHAGGCGLALKHYGRLLATQQAVEFSTRVLDIHELLARAPLRSRHGALAIRAAVHDCCHLRHGQGVSDAVVDVLQRIPGLELVALAPAAGACCGAPGIHAASAPLAAAALGRRQAQAAIETGADLVLSADGGCASQLRRHLRELGSTLEVRHPVELLARSRLR